MTGSSSIGVYSSGSGPVNVRGDAIGTQINQPEPGRREQRGGSGVDIGILTVLREEMQAVVAVLSGLPGYRSYTDRTGVDVHEATVRTDGGTLRVVATQTARPGQAGADAAYRWLTTTLRPSVVLLVGIAGGIRSDVAIGDVVISDEIIMYDARRETADGARRRGEAQTIAALLHHRVNAYRLRYGETIDVPPAGPVRVFFGPIGSGGAVITDQHSDIRRYLAEVNEKTLAVETEAAAVAHAFYYGAGHSDAPRAWLTIRGISDHADAAKGHADHQLASNHAAAVMARLLPLLGVSLT